VTLTFDLSTSKWDHGSHVASFCHFQHPRSFRSRLRVRYGTDRQTDRRTDDGYQHLMPPRLKLWETLIDKHQRTVTQFIKNGQVITQQVKWIIVSSIRFHIASNLFAMLSKKITTKDTTAKWSKQLILYICRMPWKVAQYTVYLSIKSITPMQYIVLITEFRIYNATKTN